MPRKEGMKGLGNTRVAEELLQLTQRAGCNGESRQALEALGKLGVDARQTKAALQTMIFLNEKRPGKPLTDQEISGESGVPTSKVRKIRRTLGLVREAAAAVG